MTNSTLPAVTQALAKLRASPINGRGMCTGIAPACTARTPFTPGSQVRLNLVAAWREATVFTEAERDHRPARWRLPASVSG